MQKFEPLLSFCCVSYNHAPFIEYCIKSIWNNDYKNIEILVLDDGSNDNSVEILERLQKISPCDMQIIAQENCGIIGKNFNTLIHKAKGEFISIIACDDMLTANSIQIKMNLFQNDKNLAFVCHSKILAVDNFNNEIENFPDMELFLYKNPTIEDILQLDFEKIHSYYLQGSIFNAKIICTIGGFDEDMICDDIILRTKLSRYLIDNPQYTFKVLKSPGVHYRRHNSNISNNSARQVMGVCQYLDRYWPDKKIPKLLQKWLGGALVKTSDKRNLLEQLNIYSSARQMLVDKYIDEKFVYYKKRGIPYIFEIFSCTDITDKNKNKVKIIKLFSMKILKYKKIVK